MLGSFQNSWLLMASLPLGMLASGGLGNPLGQQPRELGREARDPSSSPSFATVPLSEITEDT
jgi:hypothetical protein